MSDLSGSRGRKPYDPASHHRRGQPIRPCARAQPQVVDLRRIARAVRPRAAGVVQNLTEYIGPSEVSSVDEIAAGEGAVLRQGALKLACYKADDGTITRRSASCTHMACIVHWNTFEKCWDCRCHGEIRRKPAASGPFLWSITSTATRWPSPLEQRRFELSVRTPAFRWPPTWVPRTASGFGVAPS
jgi:hypothetical protein